jgi:hypothetical protein
MINQVRTNNRKIVTYLQPHNSRNLGMHVEVKNAPCRLGCRDVPTLDPSRNLISLVADFEASNISTLLDVFKGILEGTEGDSTFNVDMAIVFCGEVRGYMEQSKNCRLAHREHHKLGRHWV